MVREPIRERTQSSLPVSSQRTCQRMSTCVFSSMCHSSSLLLALLSLTRFTEAPPPIPTVAHPASHIPSLTKAHPVSLLPSTNIIHLMSLLPSSTMAHLCPCITIYQVLFCVPIPQPTMAHHVPCFEPILTKTMCLPMVLASISSSVPTALFLSSASLWAPRLCILSSWVSDLIWVSVKLFNDLSKLVISWRKKIILMSSKWSSF